MVAWWLLLIIGIVCLLIGGAIGFAITKKIVKKQLQQNPPISAKQIRIMYQQMGRKPSEADVQRVLKSVQKAK